MFWNKSENKDNNQEPNTNEESRETRGIIPPENDGEVDNIINNVLSDFKGSEMRSKASDRVESLELNKFPVCGQIRNYYRYGDLTLCDKQSEKLNFCFSNSLKTEDQKRINVQEFYKNRLVEQLKRGSSEDIWESRD
ncbi:hypothetical protein CAS74_004352 [Pichia kudriavzevii]|uniref:Early meiotic induction protein 1 n=1 Tax=Pichia kudriavzevii TaxID=4909 RepID=A0A1Z8JJB9_PICKU|nr:hypothetical protein CAS74_004352 [Pichia kudriavzevii]